MVKLGMLKHAKHIWVKTQSQTLGNWVYWFLGDGFGEYVAGTKPRLSHFLAACWEVFASEPTKSLHICLEEPFMHREKSTMLPYFGLRYRINCLE